MFNSDNRRKKWYDLLGLMPGRVGRWLIILSIIPLTIAVVLGVYAWRASNYDLNNVLAPLENSVVYDRHGSLIGTLSDKARINALRKDLPYHLIDAFVAREDEDFYSHNGVAYTSVARSVLKNLTTFSFAQGASTITMQLARNTFELRKKTLDRKILEIFIARRIENKYNKDTILTSYLNRIYFGQQCYGITQAAGYYFGKEVRALSLGECATLAGIVRGPSIFNPVDNYSAAKRERNDTLDRMVESGFITKEQAEAEKAKELNVVAQKTARSYSYPVFWVNKALEKYDADIDLEVSSIYVMTSFDLKLQRKLELMVEPKIRELESSAVWQNLPKRMDDKAAGCLQVAAICVESKSGEVLAVLNGRCPLDGANRWESPKKPGLMFLPFVNLAAALSGGNIIRNESVTTGKSVGYTKMVELAEMIGIEGTLPRSDQLYEGQFLSSLLPFIRGYLMIQQRGMNVELKAIKQIATNRNNLIYDYRQVARDERKEVLKREYVYAVAGLPPLKVGPGKKTVSMNIELPDYYGRFHGKMGRDKSFFLWVGFDEPKEEYWKQKGVGRAIEKMAEDIVETMYEAMTSSGDPKGQENNGNH